MKVNQIYFSPTGGTKRVIELLAAAWEGEGRTVDLSSADKEGTAYTFAKEELCLIGVPSFGGRVPAVAITRLKRIKAAGTPAIVVSTYGNRDYDDTLLELLEAAKQCGFHVIAAIAAVTEHSIMHQFGTGRPDAADQKELSTFAEKIRQGMESHGALQEVTVKGHTPYKAYGGLPLKPGADKSCNRCGICAAKCPVSAIPAEDPAQTLKDACITCMRCIAICPQHARKLNPALLFVAENKLKKACSGRKENEFFF